MITRGAPRSRARRPFILAQEKPPLQMVCGSFNLLLSAPRLPS